MPGGNRGKDLIEVMSSPALCFICWQIELPQSSFLKIDENSILCLLAAVVKTFIGIVVIVKTTIPKPFTSLVMHHGSYYSSSRHNLLNSLSLNVCLRPIAASQY